MIQQESKVSQIRTRFANESNIKVTNEWLNGCIAFFLQSNPQLSIHQLYKEAYSQFILADLREIAISTLPETVQHKTEQWTLTGKYTLQMHYLIDISESAYEQYRKIHDIKLDDAEENLNRTQGGFKANKKRTLKLELTDGHKTVTAMEVKPIPCLHTKLTAGVKILLSGPIKVVNKVLFLESKNVKVLGGEVDTLLITNAYENVLLKALKKPLTAKPKQDYYEEPVTVEPVRRPHNIIPRPMGTKARPVATRSAPPPSKFDYEDDDDFESIDLDNLPGLSTVKPQNPKPIDDNFDDDDDDIMMMQLEILENAEKLDQTKKTDRNQSFPDENELMEFQETSNVRVRNTEPQFDDDDDDMVDQLSQIDYNPVNSNPSTSSNYFTSHSTPSPTTVSSKFDKLKKIHEVPAKKSRLEIPEIHEIFESPKKRICDLEYPHKIGNTNIATIDQFLELTYEERINKVLIFHAGVRNYWKPLRLKNDEWILGCTLEDDYSEGELKVNMNSEMMGRLAGVEAREFIRMKQQAASKPQLLLEIEEIIHSLKARLEDLSTFMKVSTEAGKEYPEVFEMIDVTPANQKIFDRKIKEEALKQRLGSQNK